MTDEQKIISGALNGAQAWEIVDDGRDQAVEVTIALPEGGEPIVSAFAPPGGCRLRAVLNVRQRVKLSLAIRMIRRTLLAFGSFGPDELSKVVLDFQNHANREVAPVDSSGSLRR